MGKTKETIKLEANAAWPEGVWTQIHDEDFEALKGALLMRPVLNYHNLVDYGDWQQIVEGGYGSCPQPSR